jgi:signal transduction histidine kinase
LHDEISQSLTAMIFEVDTILTTNLFNRVDVIKHHLNHMRDELVRVTDEVNRIVLDLRPTLLENNGLIAALGWYGTERLRPAGVKLHLSSGQCVPHLSDCATTMLYRIAQEALTNVVRHAQAAKVWFNLTCQDDYLLMTIQDDGRGFDPGQAVDYPNSAQGIGLLGMQERAMLLNGNFSINTRPGHGVEIEIRIPVEEATGETHQGVAGRRPCGAAR